MTNESNTFTINLPNPKIPNKTVNESSDSPTVTYIIERNQVLDEENKELRQEVQVLSSKLEEEEEYNDVNQKKNNNLKMVLKNLLETQKEQDIIVELNKKINKLRDENVSNNYKNHTKIYNIMMISIVCSMMGFIMSCMYPYYMVIVALTLMSFSVNYYMFIEIKKYNNDIITLKQELSKNIKDTNITIQLHQDIINKMKTTTDYMNEYIDII